MLHIHHRKKYHTPMKNTDSITARHADSITGSISCFDRLILQGTLNPCGHPSGMTSLLYQRSIRIFDFPQFSKPITEKIRANILSVAQRNDVPITFVRKHTDRKVNLVAEIISKRGDHPGIVCILSAMETCSTFEPWHDKKSGKTFLRPDTGKCLHYYVYLIDRQFGLCHVRVPTWLPCRLQVYINGHNRLASLMKSRSMQYSQCDNLFTHIDNFDAAQKLSNSFDVEQLHRFLDQCAQDFCPILDNVQSIFRWSIMQAEYATDILFSSKKSLAPLYDRISRTAAVAVKAANIATFLGRKLSPNYKDEMGNNFSTRIEGTRIRHCMGPVSIKAYDKLGIALRIETTTNDVSFFKHFRDVQQDDGIIVNKIASMRKSIYSLPDLAVIMRDANHRYLEFLSALDDPSDAAPKLERLSKTVSEDNHPYKGFNLFDSEDLNLLRTIARGEFNITGFQNRHLRVHLTGLTSSKATRIIKRLKIHGLIRKVRGAYKYRLSSLGMQVVALGLKIREFFITPQLALC
jgi:hypothetical protein